MILADGINLPIVLLLGLATLGPLTLLVVAIESLTLRGLYRVPIRASLKVILVANVLSTVAGLLVYMFQDEVLYLIGVRTPADFARHYLFGASVLIGLYFIVSVVVEALYIARRRFVALLGLRRRTLWQAVFAANVASYLLMGPVFYFSTRPTFHGLEFVDGPASVANCTDTIYFIAAADEHLYRVQANGHRLTEVVPYEVREFLVSADQSTFLYRGADGNLWYYGPENAQPKCIWQTNEEFLITDVDLSADKTRVAYASLRKVVVYDLAKKRIVAQTELPMQNREWHPVGLVAWDADDSNVLHLGTVLSGQHAWRVDEGSLTLTTAADPHLAGNFRRCAFGCSWGGRHDWGVPLPAVQQRGEMTLRAMPGVGRHVWVGTGERTLAMFQNDYGLLGLGYPGPDEACFLSAPGVVLCGGSDCMYVLNVQEQRVAELVKGHSFVVALPEFQASLSHDASGSR